MQHAIPRQATGYMNQRVRKQHRRTRGGWGPGIVLLLAAVCGLRMVAINLI